MYSSVSMWWYLSFLAVSSQFFLYKLIFCKSRISVSLTNFVNSLIRWKLYIRCLKGKTSNYIILYNEQITYAIKLTEGKPLKFFNRRISFNVITCKFYIAITSFYLTCSILGWITAVNMMTWVTRAFLCTQRTIEWMLT